MTSLLLTNLPDHKSQKRASRTSPVLEVRAFQLPVQQQEARPVPSTCSSAPAARLPGAQVSAHVRCPGTQQSWGGCAWWHPRLFEKSSRTAGLLIYSWCHGGHSAPLMKRQAANDTQYSPNPLHERQKVQMSDSYGQCELLNEKNKLPCLNP